MDLGLTQDQIEQIRTAFETRLTWEQFRVLGGNCLLDNFKGTEIIGIVCNCPKCTIT